MDVWKCLLFVGFLFCALVFVSIFEDRYDEHTKMYVSSLICIGNAYRLGP